jgi:hypothetical protein
MEEKGLMAVFLVPIVAIILLGIIWSTVQTAVAPTTVANESFTGVNNTYVTLDNDDLIAVSAVRNGTQFALTVTTHYVTDLSGGRINITTAGAGLGTGSGSTYYVDYTYRADSYLASSTSRMIVGYLPLMAAVVIFVFIAGYAVMKKAE